MPVSEAKKAISNKEIVKKVEKAFGILKEWSALAKAHATDEQKQFAYRRAHGRLEVSLAACALDKRSREHLTMEDAGRGILEEFAKDVGKEMVPPLEWMDKTSIETPSPASSKVPSAAIRQYDDHGKLTNPAEVLAALGFKPGEKVKRSDTIAQIDEIRLNDVQLIVQEDGQDKKKFLVSTASFIQGEWKVYSEPKQQTEIMWLSDAPGSSHDFKAAALKAKITTAMFEQVQAAKDFLTLPVFAGPRAVTVPRNFAAKKLQIPCATTRVQLLDPSKAGPEDLCIGRFESMVVVITGFSKFDKDGNGNGFQNPFWLIPKSDEPDECNMEVPIWVASALRVREATFFTECVSIHVRVARCQVMWFVLFKHIYICICMYVSCSTSMNAQTCRQ